MVYHAWYLPLNLTRICGVISHWRVLGWRLAATKLLLGKSFHLWLKHVLILQHDLLLNYPLQLVERIYSLLSWHCWSIHSMALAASSQTKWPTLNWYFFFVFVLEIQVHWECHIMELTCLNLDHQVTSFVMKAVAFDLTLQVWRAG